jgi:putative glutamine amidotransferase
MNSSIPSRRPPVVLVPACNRMLGQHPFHVAGQKYVDAVRLAGALPLVVPSASREELDALLDLADGVLLTGSPSNVHPSHFGQPVHDDTLPLDPARDDWTLPLIPKLVARGGTLHQAVQEVDGLADHRSRSEDPVEVQYGPAHPVRLAPEGLMARALGTLGRPADIVVNSVHGQGVSRLAEGLNIEARAPDGLVEAFSIGGHPQGPVFQLAVQWHPEWQAASNPVSMALLRAFGLACQDYRDLHRPPSR